MKPKNVFFVIFLGLICFLQCGCSLLALPFQVAGAAIGVASEAVSLAGSLPMPPPWVFF